jgi:hypothetical protein
MKKYKIVGDSIIVFANCRFIADEKALEQFPRNPGSIYTYEKYKNNIIIYELPQEVLKEIRQIQDFYTYKIIPYASCVLRAIGQTNFIFIDRYENSVIISAYGEKQITQPTSIDQTQFESQKETILNSFKNILGIPEPQIIEKPIHWEANVEFLLPEILQYRTRQRKSKEEMVAWVIFFSLVGIGVYLFLTALSKNSSVSKKYQQLLTQQANIQLQRTKLLTLTYQTQISQNDKSHDVVNFILEILDLVRRTYDCQIEKVEYNQQQGQLVATISTTTYNKKIKEKYPDCQIKFESGKVKYEISKKIGEANETETTLAR